MTEKKTLRRSDENRVIAGVCAGLGEYFDLDPVLIRVIFVLAALLGGPGLIAYVVLWLILPKTQTEDAA